MMSLINTNYSYLATMGISEEDPLVGIIVSVYYLGCTAGAILASWYADAEGRKSSIFGCLATACLGNLLMFLAGLGQAKGALAMMLTGRFVMGMGIGGVDSIVPVYSSELAQVDGRGTALAQEFQANIFGLNMAFIINVLLTNSLGKFDQWAWRLPIIIMQIYPILLFTVIARLPESPRWYILQNKKDKAKASITNVFGEDQAEEILDSLLAIREEEEKKGAIGYIDMLNPYKEQFHPTCVTIMGQVNQALTGYGAVSVYGPQIFELLGFGVMTAEYITLGNYLFYLAMMTFAWVLIDRLGRRTLMIYGGLILAVAFALLTLLGGLAFHSTNIGISSLTPGILGTIILYLSTSTFGIGWLVPPWLIPTEIYPSTARAQGAAISVIIWGLANFAVTLLTPIGFNNLKYWLFFVFAATNSFAAWWTAWYSPESGGRTFEENQEFFMEAREKGSWKVGKVKGGAWKYMPNKINGDGVEDGVHQGETSPLLGRS